MDFVQMKITVMKCIDKKVHKSLHILKLLPVSRSRTKHRNYVSGSNSLVSSTLAKLITVHLYRGT